MNTIEEAARDFLGLNESNPNYEHTENNVFELSIFKAGVEFAQRWISVEDELPDIGEEVLVKRELRQGDTWVQHFCSVSTRLTPSGEWEDIKWSDVGFIRGIVTHWRPIELK